MTSLAAAYMNNGNNVPWTALNPHEQAALMDKIPPYDRT